MINIKMTQFFFRGNYCKKGSLLLESLLAVSILSIGIAFIVKAMSNSLRAVSTSSSYSDAFILADNQMSIILQKGVIETGINKRANFPYPDDMYHYSLETILSEKDMGGISNLEEENKVNQLTYKIMWKTGKKENSLELNTYVFKLDAFDENK